MADAAETVKRVVNPIRLDGSIDWPKVGVALGFGACAYLAFLGVASAATTENDETGETISPASPEGRSLADQAKAASGGNSKTLGEKAVEVLSRHVGAHEEPWPTYPKKPSPNSNRGPVVDQILRGVHNDGEKLLGKAWCARATRYAYEKAAQELGLPPPFKNIKDSLAMVSSWNKQFKKYKISEPKVGATALLKNLSHSTIVARINPDGSVTTIEGNHGDAVANVRRKPSDLIFLDIDAFVRDQGERVSGYILGTDVLIAGV